MQNNKQRDAFKATLIQKTADITTVSTRQVRRVINGTCKNETVMTVYMELLEGSEKLVDAVKNLIPFGGVQDMELKVGYTPRPLKGERGAGAESGRVRRNRFYPPAP